MGGLSDANVLNGYPHGCRRCPRKSAWPWRCTRRASRAVRARGTQGRSSPPGGQARKRTHLGSWLGTGSYTAWLLGSHRGLTSFEGKSQAASTQHSVRRTSPSSALRAFHSAKSRGPRFGPASAPAAAAAAAPRSAGLSSLPLSSVILASRPYLWRCNAHAVSRPHQHRRGWKVPEAREPITDEHRARVRMCL